MPMARPKSPAHPRALVRALALALIVSACGPSAPSEGARDGRGLVILPDEGPLARGVEVRDPRLNFHDFGRVTDGDVVTRVFRLRNEDPRPVSIQRVDPGCGCTVASLRVLRADGSLELGAPISSKLPSLLEIGPGEVAELEVRVDTRDLTTKNDHRLITIRVLTNSPSTLFLTFEVHLLVEQAFTVAPAKLALGDVPENGGGEGKVEFVRAGGFTYEPIALEPTPAGVTAELSVEQRNGMPVWTLTARVAPPLPRGPFERMLRVTVEEEPGVPGRPIEVPLTALVVEDLASLPQRLVFPAPRESAERASVELFSRLAGHRLRVLSAAVDPAHATWLAARVEPLEPDDGGASLRWRVTLETRPPLPAEETLLSGELALVLDDPQHPSFTLPYVVHLR
jgi:hypothetical protein